MLLSLRHVLQQGNGLDNPLHPEFELLLQGRTTALSNQFVVQLTTADLVKSAYLAVRFCTILAKPKA